MNEIYICIKDFHMESGERTFTRGKFYINDAFTPNGMELSFIDDEEHIHTMEQVVIKDDDYNFFEHFKRVITM